MEKHTQHTQSGFHCAKWTTTIGQTLPLIEGGFITAHTQQLKKWNICHQAVILWYIWLQSPWFNMISTVWKLPTSKENISKIFCEHADFEINLAQSKLWQSFHVSNFPITWQTNMQLKTKTKTTRASQPIPASYLTITPVILTVPWT